MELYLIGILWGKKSTFDVEIRNNFIEDIVFYLS